MTLETRPLCRLAAQVSQYYHDIEELESISQLRKYLGQVTLKNAQLLNYSLLGQLFPPEHIYIFSA